MLTRIGELTLIKHHDHIGLHKRGKAVRDHHHGLTARNAGQIVYENRLAFGVKRTSRLIQN